jgi:hypothetical protein
LLPEFSAMPLDAADTYESGGDPTAQASYTRLAGLAGNFNDAEVALINWLRKVYRKCTPVVPEGTFVPAGVLVFHGANIRLRDDNGKVYNKLKARNGLTVGDRTGLTTGSSHESKKNQFEINLRELGCILVGYGPFHFNGTRMGGNNTWIQNESHAATGSYSEWFWHGMSFVDHKWNNCQQVGALGYSPYSEKKGNPLNCRPVPAY